MSKPIFLFYRFQSIINKSHKSFIHNHFVCRLLFFSIVDYDPCVSKRRCSKAERERKGGKRKEVFLSLARFFYHTASRYFITSIRIVVVVVVGVRITGRRKRRRQ